MNPLTHARNSLAVFFFKRLGYLLARRGVHGGAAWYFKEAQVFFPGDVSGLFDLARAQWLDGDAAAAKDLLQRIVDSAPDHAKAQNLLGVVARAEYRLDDAEDRFRHAIALSPEWAAPQNNLGSVFLDRDDLVMAEQCFRRALEHDAEYVESLNNLALLLNRCGRYADAERMCREALRLKPDFAGAVNNLGSILLNLGSYADGVAQYREALRLQPDMVEVQVNLAVSLDEPGRLIGLMDHFHRMLEHNPKSYIALIRLGQAHLALSELEKAEDFARRACAQNPELIDPYGLLTSVLGRQGDVSGTLECFHQALERGGGLATRGSYLFHLLYDPACTAERFFEEASEWNRLCTEVIGHLVSDVSSFSNVRDPNRKLRIGYLSKDFCAHSVAFYIEPVIVRHDRQHFEIFCYANLHHPDAVTERFKRMADSWREIALMNDDDLSRMIREDRIDILVDLSGHTSGARSSALARRLAPLQINYLGYPATTGLSTIDYRIVDAITDPPGIADQLHSEKLLRLPGGFLTYQPASAASPVAPPPCLSNGFVTFGTFNNINKVNDNVVDVWSRILHEVPDSRLMLKGEAMGFPRSRQRVLDQFAARGVAPAQLVLNHWQDVAGHLNSFAALDIGLDPFPYNGTTTTCETLWMGVPVVTLLGDRHSGRVGASLLIQLGMPELVCDSVDTYVQTAVELALDPQRLASLRASLRERMQASPLLDHAGFTRKLEAAYRDVWAQTVELLKTEKHPS